MPEQAENCEAVAPESVVSKNRSYAECLYGAVQPNQLAFIPSIRFVPKKLSMRPITNLRSSFLRNKRGSTSAGGSVGTSAAVSAEFLCADGARHSGPLRANKQHISNAHTQLAATTISNAPPPFLVSNATLYNILHVLRDITIRKPELCGFGVLGSDGIYSRLKDYKMRALSCRAFLDHRKPHKAIPKRYVDVSDTPFYIATLDLDKCFDSMDTAQLFDLVQNLILGQNSGGYDLESGENNNLVHKYNVSHYIPSLEKKVLCSAGIFSPVDISSLCLPAQVVKSVKNVTKGNDLIPFFEAVNTLTENRRNCIISDGKKLHC